MRTVEAMHILIVEDDPDTQANLRDILELDGHRVQIAGTAREVLDQSDWKDFSVVILDRLLPDGTAEQLLPQLKERAPETAVIIGTGYSDLHGAISALRHGAEDYILKPIDPDALRVALERIARRRQLALEKARSEAALRNLVEAAPCMIVIVRPDGTIAYFSPFAEQLTGYMANEVLGRNYFPIFVLDEQIQKGIFDAIAQILAGTPTRGYENPIRCKDGSHRSMVWNAQRLDDYEGATAVLAVGQDITEIKQTQTRLLQSERLAAIGEAMTGLAHESRNALQRSHACLEMLAMEVEGRQEAIELIARARKAQEHLHRMYEEVQNYAAPIQLKRERVRLDEIVGDAWFYLIEVRKGRNVRLQYAADSADVHCDVDRFSLERVFRNVLENSLAACSDPVEILVKWSESHSDGRPAVCVTIRDNGPGLTAEAKQRIFEPFFTTRLRGTGLGMAIAKRIVEAHGGWIIIGDGAGPGAEFVLSLPRETP